MNHSFMLQLRKSIFSPIMILSIFVGTAMLIMPLDFRFMAWAPQKSLYLNLITTSHSVGVFDLFAPILVVLPASGAFCEEVNSGYIKFILTRTSKAKYIIEKIILCTISGGLACTVPTLILSIFSMIVGRPYFASDVPATFSPLFTNTIFDEIQFVGGGMLVVAILLLFAFLFGAAWACVGLCISSIFVNKYVTYALPFILYFALFILLYNIDGALKYSPVNMLFPNIPIIPSIAFVITYQTTICVVSISLFTIIAARRLTT